MLLVASSDKRDGHIWNAEDVKARIFEPSFATKVDWKGTGLFAATP